MKKQEIMEHGHELLVIQGTGKEITRLIRKLEKRGSEFYPMFPGYGYALEWNVKFGLVIDRGRPGEYSGPCRPYWVKGVRQAEGV